MADRYWVGGDGNWNQPNLHWSDSSGGTPSAAFLPTSADNVIFDANSNSGTSVFTVCVDETAQANCLDFSTSSLDGAMTLLMNSTSVLNVYGSLTLPATNFTWSAVTGANVNFLATTTGKTITTNGVGLTAQALTFNGIGGEWTLGSAISIGNNITVTAGSFVSGNYSINANAFASTGTATRSVSLGSSNLTFGGTTFFTLSGSGLTWNAGTSTISCSNASSTFNGGGYTFYNVEFSGGASTKTINGANTYNGTFKASNATNTIVTFGANQTFVGAATFSGTAQTINGAFSHTGSVTFDSTAAGTHTINSAITWQNLTINAPIAAGTRIVSLAANQTVTGTLTTNGTRGDYRTNIVSSVAGTQRTLTVATLSAAASGFQDMIAAGAASWSLPVGNWDLGNNTGITFNTSTLYWVGSTGNWYDGTKWATSSGGAGGAASAVPGPQNSVIFDANSNTGTGSFTVTVTNNACNNFSTGGAGGALDGAMTLAFGTGTLNVYGSWTTPSTNLSITATSATINWFATSTGKLITTNGVSFSSATAFNFSGLGGGWTLVGALTCGAITHTAGSFDTAGYSVTPNSNFTSSGTNSRTLSFGASTITTGSSSPITFSGSNFTFNAGTSTINCSAASPTFNGGGYTFYNVNFTSNALGTTTITGANTFNNLSQTSRAAVGLRAVVLVSNQTINGTLTLGAANAGNQRIQVYGTNAPSLSVGVPVTLTVATLATLSDVTFKDIIAAGTSAPWSGTRIGDAGGNSNITFATAKTVYWNLAAGGSWSATAWATSSGGTASNNNFPLPQDTAIIENTGLNTSATITIDTNWYVGTISAATRTNAWTFAGASAHYLAGDYTLNSTTNATIASLFVVKIGGTQTITTNGVALSAATIAANTTGTVRINGNLTLGSTQTFNLAQGTLDLTNNGAGNYTLSTGVFISSANTTRAITFGTGNITITGNNGTVWSMATATNFSYAGTPTVNLTYSGATGTRTIQSGSTSAHASGSEPTINITAGTDTVSATGQFKNIDLTGFSGTFANIGRSIVGDFVISSGTTLGTGTSSTSFVALSGTQKLTTAGKALDFPVTVGTGTSTNTLQLQDNLTMGSTRQFTLTSGTLDLTGNSGNWTLSTGFFVSSGANTRSIVFGTGNITLTGNNGALWSTSVATNLSYTGTPTVNATYSGAIGFRGLITNSTSFNATEANSFNFNFTAGSDIIQFNSTATRTAKSVDFTGFSGSLTASAALVLYGNLKLSNTMIIPANTSAMTFAGTSGTQQITTNGQTLDFPLTFNGVGGTFAFQDALTQGSTRAFTITNGTVQLKAGVTSTVGLFATSGTNQKYLQSTLAGTQATLSQASGTVSASYLTIKDILATGGAEWYAFYSNNNVDSGNNSGWVFNATNNFFLVF